MVKKVKFIEEQPSPDDISQQNFQEQLLDYLKAIDWKLWEILKIEQARDEKENETAETDAVSEILPEKKTVKSKKKYKPIIIDEDG